MENLAHISEISIPFTVSISTIPYRNTCYCRIQPCLIKKDEIKTFNSKGLIGNNWCGVFTKKMYKLKNILYCFISGIEMK